MSAQARSNRPKVTRQNCVAELCGGPVWRPRAQCCEREWRAGAPTCSKVTSELVPAQDGRTAIPGTGQALSVC